MEEPVRKQARKEKPEAAGSASVTQSDGNTLDSSSYLTYDILRIIFQYLSAKDLANAAIVCRSWLEAANKEKRTRGPCCFMQAYKTEDYLSNINNIRVKPSLGLFFIPNDLPADIEERIEALLPDDCKAVMLYGKGIIMDNNEMEYHSLSSMACAFLPQIPNVQVKLFKLTECEFCIIRRSIEYEQIISTIDNDEISSNQMSTCCMLFCNNAGHTIATRWSSVIQKSKRNKVTSVWGGVLKDIHVKCPNNLCKTSKYQVLHRMDAPHCFAVLITGSIQTWSMILDKKCKTKEQAEERLKLFKNKVKLKKHSIGFMFVCNARGSNLYDENHIESTIFKKLFPKVPLAGCFGYGEFGKNTFDETNEEKNSEEGQRPKRSKSWYNEFSSVFLILTYD
ncbi:uncharacterized protein LOC105200213 [Solenopsis invicta]|uniref:uncharacterized protein LOC105200213 n=1 Tax=Solenopsis invicta TaxID=13686 RepID=UPI0005961871|nr:uncharacterized protein LOC105200213 [Solenopsis invicta]